MNNENITKDHRAYISDEDCEEMILRIWKETRKRLLFDISLTNDQKEILSMIKSNCLDFLNIH